ncbi:MAG: hypothetical protein ACLQLG_02315 [Thermoguttaceae bacterium]
MGVRTRWLAVVVTAALGVAAVVWAVCRREPITSWSSPRVLAVQKEWQSLMDSFRHTWTKNNFGQRHKMLESILDKGLSKEDLRRLAATCGTLPVREKDRTEFANALLKFMVRAFVDAGDRDSLLEVLSTRCPDFIFPYEPVEFFLASSSGKLKDPILILGDAFAKCRVPQNRRHIAVAFRRGFTGSGIHGKDDAEFVKNAIAWYEKEKGHLVVNGGNRPWGMIPLYDEDEPYYKTLQYDKIPPLFVRPTATPEGAKAGGR